MTSDQDRDESYRHNDTYDRLAHPHYPLFRASLMAEPRALGPVMLGDEVALRDDATLAPVGLVTAIYPEAVEVSTSDDYKVADLVLLRRAQ